MVAWNKTIQRIAEEVLSKGNPMTTPQNVEQALVDIAICSVNCYAEDGGKDGDLLTDAHNTIRDHIAALDEKNIRLLATNLSLITRAEVAEANAARLVHRVECLRGLCKSAVGYLHDAGADAEANRVFALIGDMEPPVD